MQVVVDKATLNSVTKTIDKDVSLAKPWFSLGHDRVRGIPTHLLTQKSAQSTAALYN